MNKTGKIALISAVILMLVLSVLVVSAARGNKAGRGAPKECRDGIDNDGDGNTDWPADAGCKNKNDNDETNCGDGVCEGGESSSTCAVDCVVCGNDVTEGTEVCDGSDVNGETCQSQGYDEGTLGCQVGCGAYDTSGCYDNPTQVCGNNIREGTEVCDGTDLVGETCGSQGHDGGTLACAGTCDAFVTTNCWDDSCADTDGGIDFYSQGTASGSNFGIPYSYTDFCLGGDFVVEFYCAGTSVWNTNSTCVTNSTTSCVNGACQ